MTRQVVTTISEFPLPDSLSTEMQVIADIIALPETLMEAKRTISLDMFSDDKCRDAFEALRTMSQEGMIIDLPSVYGRIDRELIQKGIIPLMGHSAGALTSSQHFSALKDMYIKRKCYFKALELLSSASDSRTSGQDLIGKVGNLADKLRKEIDAEKGTQHIADVINDLGAQIEEAMRNKAEGKVLRIPTGFYSLDYLTYGGFNAGNLVILAARPSVGKTAIMLQMAKSAAIAGKSVNLFNLEMTNTELAQRFLFSTGKLTPLQVARGEVVWQDFEDASGEFTSKPIYLNDSASSDDEIISRITLNNQAGKCDIAFIDYLGLMQMNSKATLAQSIADVTKKLKKTAKACKIPIVLLCQLNRASASEKRPPQLFDLRDSGSIEQDADIVLMLEKSDANEGDVDMWVRKNRQGKAGEIKVEIISNDTFTTFTDKNDPMLPTMPPENSYGSQQILDFADNDFDNDSDIPF